MRISQQFHLGWFERYLGKLEIYLENIQLNSDNDIDINDDIINIDFIADTNNI